MLLPRTGMFAEGRGTKFITVHVFVEKRLYHVCGSMTDRTCPASQLRYLPFIQGLQACRSLVQYKNMLHVIDFQEPGF